MVMAEAHIKSMDGKSLMQVKSQSSLLDQSRSFRLKTNNDIVCVGIDDKTSLASGVNSIDGSDLGIDYHMRHFSSKHYHTKQLEKQ
jgi:hypothetical protein